jgi:hypothetical protein
LLDHLGRQLRGERREAAEAVLLPAGDERSNAVLVGDGGPSPREREAATGALRAPRDRPDRRGAAAVAERTGETWQPGGAGAADDRAGPGAQEATPRQEELQHGRQR